MATRSLLRSHLFAAWSDTINGAYSEQLINSERGLQVHFCIALLNLFQKYGVNRRLFVEPTILFDKSTKRFPDLVICNSKRIIGVVEFKYLPRGRPDPRRDVNTLLRICTAPEEISLTNERFKGAGHPRSFTIASDAVLCWAGVYTGNLLSLPADDTKAIGSRFMRLDALTTDGTKVQIRPAPRC